MGDVCGCGRTLRASRTAMHQGPQPRNRRPTEWMLSAYTTRNPRGRGGTRSRSWRWTQTETRPHS
jgi:hypothetical protein